MTGGRTDPSQRAVDDETPLPRAWWIAFYAAVAILGVGLPGVALWFYVPGWEALAQQAACRATDTYTNCPERLSDRGWIEYIRWYPGVLDYLQVWGIWAGSGCVAAAIGFFVARRTTRVERILRAAHSMTAGGWPWQTVRCWWIPFAVTVPLALLWPLTVAHNVIACDLFPRPSDAHPEDWKNLDVVSLFFSIYGLDWLIVTCRRALALYSEQLVFPLLAVYGAVCGRAWITSVGRYLLGGYFGVLLAFVGIELFMGWAPLSEIFAHEPYYWCLSVLVLFAALGATSVVLWRRFSTEAAAVPAAAAPPPSEASPWRTTDVALLLLFPMLEHGICTLLQYFPDTFTEESYSFRSRNVAAARMILALLVVALVLYRGQFSKMLWGPRGSELSARGALYAALPFVVGFLPIILLKNPLSLICFLTRFFDPEGPGTYRILLFVAAPIGEELLFRGILLDYWTRILDRWRACVLTTLVFIGFHSAHLGASGWPPAAIVYYVIMSLALTALRLRTGAVLPCILAHAGINYFASF